MLLLLPPEVHYFSMQLDIPYFEQHGEANCGAACLRMLLARQQFFLSEEELATLAGITLEHGAERDKLTEAALQCGLQASEAFGSLHTLSSLVEQNKSAVVNYIMPELEIGHYAVLSGYTEKEVLLHDPWFGAHFSLPHQELAKRWLGYKTEVATQGWLMVEG